jgi:hypothetical protein
MAESSRRHAANKIESEARFLATFSDPDLMTDVPGVVTGVGMSSSLKFEIENIQSPRHGRRVKRCSLAKTLEEVLRDGF